MCLVYWSFHRKFSYIQHQVLFREKCRSERKNEQTIFAIYGKARESPSCRYFSLNYQICPWFSKFHVTWDISCRRKYFLLKRRVIKQIVRYISSRTVCQKEETADAWISTTSVFSIYYDLYVRCYRYHTGSWRVFFPFRFSRYIPLHFNYRILALGRGLTANYL